MSDSSVDYILVKQGSVVSAFAFDERGELIEVSDLEAPELTESTFAEEGGICDMRGCNVALQAALRLGLTAMRAEDNRDEIPLDTAQMVLQVADGAGWPSS